MYQRVTPTETLKIAQLLDPIGREDQRRQIRYLFSDALIHVLYPISGEEQGIEARREGEIGQGGDVVVCEVDCVLGTRDAQVLNRGDFMAYFNGKNGEAPW